VVEELLMIGDQGCSLALADANRLTQTLKNEVQSTTAARKSLNTSSLVEFVIFVDREEVVSLY